MIIRIEDIQPICNIIVNAVDANQLSTLTETLELKVENQMLYLGVTNKEYYVQAKINLGEDVDFHATVNAKLFLKLINQITTDTIEFNIKDNILEIKGNGKYKLPLIYDNDKLLELPQIIINNVTTEFNINSEILNSILKYNSKELVNKAIIAQEVQKLYYVDEQGCITFTSGACVNNFTLEKPVKLLFNDRLVKLFKLFKTGNVHFSLGYDALTEEIIQPKVKFENDTIKIVAILNNDSLINSVPVEAIRKRANDIYDYSVSLNRFALIEALNRLLLFASVEKNIKTYSIFKFESDKVTIYGSDNENNEPLYYMNDTTVTEPYEALIDLIDLKTTLDNCNDEYITMRFGNHQAIVVARNNIINIIPECHNK